MRHLTTPNRKIIIDPTGAADQIEQYLVSCDVFRNENAIDTAILLVSDVDHVLYNNTIVSGDDVAVYLNYKEAEDPLTAASLRFYGFVEDMTPMYDDTYGGMLHLQLRHYGRCFTDLLCGQEYGSESSNSGLDTPKEIITDATNGLVDKWVEKLLNSATNSGYTIDTNFVEDVVSGTAIKYLYYPYKPALNCLEDLQRHSQAVQGTNAGYHWIVKTEETAGPTFTNYLLLGIVGTHPAVAPDLASKWANWWNSTQADSTIVVKKDMVVNQFTMQRPEANYILYHGRFIRPGDADARQAEPRWCRATLRGRADTPAPRPG